MVVSFHGRDGKMNLYNKDKGSHPGGRVTTTYLDKQVVVLMLVWLNASSIVTKDDFCHDLGVLDVTQDLRDLDIKRMTLVCQCVQQGAKLPDGHVIKSLLTKACHSEPPSSCWECGKYNL